MKQSKTTSNQNSGKSGHSSQSKNSKTQNHARNTDKESQGLRELFEESIRDIYWAEKALTKALPKMIKNASSEELASALEEHLTVTEEQVSRLEEVFNLLGKTARGKKCEAMEGLIKEGEEVMEDFEEGIVRDAGIIGAAQKVEHYEIAAYGTLCAFAKTLGETKVLDLLEKTLQEEKDADSLLTEVAEAGVNLAAAEQDESE